jgi:hypothetical protein
MADYIEIEDLKFIVQVSNVAEKLPGYAALLGITAAQLASLRNDADFLSFAVLGSVNADDYKQNWTKIKNEARYGSDEPIISPFPEPVNVTTPPTIVAPGVEKRFRELVNIIKANPNCTPGIREALGIEKDETVFNPNEGKPTFKIELNSGSPVLKWKKGQYEGVEVWVNRGSGFVKAERDLRPPFVDKHTLPPVGQSAVWTYKMIYLLNDETIGQWSSEEKVTVFGAV